MQAEEFRSLSFVCRDAEKQLRSQGILLFLPAHDGSQDNFTQIRYENRFFCKCTRFARWTKIAKRLIQAPNHGQLIICAQPLRSRIGFWHRCIRLSHLQCVQNREWAIKKVVLCHEKLLTTPLITHLCEREFYISWNYTLAGYYFHEFSFWVRGGCIRLNFTLGLFTQNAESGKFPHFKLSEVYFG